MWNNDWIKGEDYPVWADTDVYKKTIAGGYLLPWETPKDAYMRVASTVAKRLYKPELTEKFFDSIQAELARRAFDDFEDIPGFEMAFGRGVREWKDPYDAAEFLKDFMGCSEIVKDQVITPSKTQEHLIENGFSRKEVVKMLEEHVTKRFGPLALRPVSKRKNLKSKVDVEDTEFD